MMIIERECVHGLGCILILGYLVIYLFGEYWLILGIRGGLRKVTSNPQGEVGLLGASTGLPNHSAVWGRGTHDWVPIRPIAIPSTFSRTTFFNESCELYK